MDSVRSKFETLSDDELIEVLTLKRSEYRDEAINIAKEELDRRQLILPDDILADLNIEKKDKEDNEVKEWYYAMNGERIGAISKSKLITLYKTEKIFLGTKVWKNGMPDWVELRETDLVQERNSPPPLKGNDIDNTLVWILAFAPIIGTIIEYLISGTIGETSSILWKISICINTILCIFDERKLKKAGYNTKELMLWAIFLVPVYLFRRAYLLKQKSGYAIVWCLTFAILLFAPSWLYGITNTPNVTEALNSIQDTQPIKETQPTEEEQPIEEQQSTDKLEWNKEELYADKNGNFQVAIQLLKTIGDAKEENISVSETDVAKTPWNYYGKIIDVYGQVGLIQDYPPESDIAKACGGSASEIVVISSNNTIVDFIFTKPSGDISVNDYVNLYGFPIGLVEVDNKLGGKTTQLMVVGNLAEKVILEGE